MSAVWHSVRGEKKSGTVKAFVIPALGLFLVGYGCGGSANFDLVVFNTTFSTEPIQVDLGGDSRSLNLGDGTLFRSVSRGPHILSIDGLTCAGTVRDTVEITGDTTIRYTVTSNDSTGDCEIAALVTRPKLTGALVR